MDLAARNATETLSREQARWMADEGKTLAALEELAGALGLAAPPLRIECYDISTIQGTNTVGSMVVFEEGRPRSGEYRRFKVRTTAVSPGNPDDFASHREVLRRRFFRALEAEEGVAEELRWRLPDLVVIDGGLGQVNVARGVLDSLGLHDMPAIGLAKEREEIFLPGTEPAAGAVGQLAGALPAPAAARRGAPLRDHLPPPAARQEPDEVGARRPAGRRSGTQARPAAGLRIDPSDALGDASRRSPRCPESAARWPRRSTRVSTPKQRRSASAPLRAKRSGAAAAEVACETPERFLNSRERETALQARSNTACYSPAGMRRFLPVLILIVGLAALAVNFLPLGRPFSEPPTPIDTRLGLDLQGGLRGEYRALPTETSPITPQTLADIRTIIENRINQYGVAEPIVQTQGSDRIVVEIPGVSNEQDVRSAHRLDGPTRFRGSPAGPRQRSPARTADSAPI